MLQLFSQCRIWVHLIRIRSKGATPSPIAVCCIRLSTASRSGMQCPLARLTASLAPMNRARAGSSSVLIRASTLSMILATYGCSVSPSPSFIARFGRLAFGSGGSMPSSSARHASTVACILAPFSSRNLSGCAKVSNAALEADNLSARGVHYLLHQGDLGLDLGNGCDQDKGV